MQLESTHMSWPWLIAVDNFSTIVNQGQSQSADRHRRQELSITVDRIATWAAQCQSHSTDWTHERIKVDRSRQNRQMRRTVSIVFDKINFWANQVESQPTKFDTYANQDRSLSTESTNEPITLYSSQLSRKMNHPRSIRVNRVNKWAWECWSQSTKWAHDTIRVAHSRQSRHRIWSVSVTVDRVDERVMVSRSQQSRHKSQAGSITVNKNESWANKCQSQLKKSQSESHNSQSARAQSTEPTQEPISVNLNHRVDTWVDHDWSQLTNLAQESIRVNHSQRIDTGANQCQSQSTSLAHEPTGVGHSRESRDMRESRSIAVDRIYTWANQDQSQSTESTHEQSRSISANRVETWAIAVDRSQQNQKMSLGGSITVDKVGTSSNQYQSQSTESTHERIRVYRSRHSRQMSRRCLITVDKVGIRYNQSPSR